MPPYRLVPPPRVILSRPTDASADGAASGNSAPREEEMAASSSARRFVAQVALVSCANRPDALGAANHRKISTAAIARLPEMRL